LKRLGFAQKRWQEIVNDVDPELRFVVRPKILDAIIGHIYRVGEPVAADLLIAELMSHEGRQLRRIRQSIAANLRRGNLVLHPDNTIGLPEWKKRTE
jgi:hypothetical protein